MTTTTETLAKDAEAEIQTLADKNADSTDSNIRYMAYGSRLRTALVASSRYVAYVRLVGVLVFLSLFPRVFLLNIDE